METTLVSLVFILGAAFNRIDLIFIYFIQFYKSILQTHTPQ